MGAMVMAEQKRIHSNKKELERQMCVCPQPFLKGASYAI
jgi:hypothetical protein